MNNEDRVIEVKSIKEFLNLVSMSDEKAFQDGGKIFSEYAQNIIAAAGFAGNGLTDLTDEQVQFLLHQSNLPLYKALSALLLLLLYHLIGRQIIFISPTDLHGVGLH